MPIESGASDDGSGQGVPSEATTRVLARRPADRAPPADPEQPAAVPGAQACPAPPGPDAATLSLADAVVASARVAREHRLPDRYRLIEQIGTGGMGSVYRARDSVLDREVAVKLLSPTGPEDSLGRQRLQREAMAVARVRHPNIVDVYDVDPEGRFMVMELVQGESVRDIVARDGPLPAAEVRDIIDRVLGALHAAHSAEIVHRDVKPGNIMREHGGRVVLVDFGVAHLVDAEMTHTGQSLGTPAFMAPEQLRGGKVDARSDVYAVGATAYTLLVGEKLESLVGLSKGEQDKLRHATDDAPLVALITKCLAPDPADRPASAAVARLALRSRRRLSRRRLVALAVVCFCLGAAAAVANWAATRPDPTAPLGLAWVLVLKGQFEEGAALLRPYLGEHPGDPEALTLQVVLAWWTGSDGGLPQAIERAKAARLSPVQSAFVRGLELNQASRAPEAVALLEKADREHPDEPLIQMLLGEIHWHNGRLAQAVGPLRRAFELDPRWQLALHHVEQLYLSRGDASALAPLASRLRAQDEVAGARLEAVIALGERHYQDAVDRLRAPLAAHPDAAALWLVLARAYLLLGDIDAGERAAREAFSRSPVDDRETGGLTAWAEPALYRGSLIAFHERVGDKPHHVRTLLEVLWRGQPGPPIDLTTSFRFNPPYVAAAVLRAHVEGKELPDLYSHYHQGELHALGRGLAAERRGEPSEAARQYRAGLEVDSDGTLRMLLAYLLARSEVRAGSLRAAARACDEVLYPRAYHPYRALVLPDCERWTADAETDPKRAERLRRRLAARWTGSFEHPAVVAVRAALALAPAPTAASSTAFP